MTADTYLIEDPGATFSVTPALDDRTSKGPEYSAPSPNDDVAGRMPFKITQSTSGKGVMRTEFKLVVPNQDANGDYPDYDTVSVIATRTTRRDPADVAQRVEALCHSIASGALNADLQHLLAGGK